MQLTMPPSATDRNISSIQFAIDRKKAEVETASRNLNDLQAELRGLQAALEAISPKAVGEFTTTVTAYEKFKAGD